MTGFRSQYVPSMEVDRISREFLNLEQMTEAVIEMTRKFTEMALFCPQYVGNEEMKITRYTDMLRTEIREFMATTKHKTLADLIDGVRRRELELETQNRKRKAT